MNYIPELESLSYRIRVLLVEGEWQFRTRYQQLLSEAGYDVVTALSGELALKQLDSDTFDVIVTDSHLPGIDSDRLVRIIRLKQSDVPIILMSAYPNIADQARRCGADTYYEKSESLSSLLTKIVATTLGEYVY